MTKPAPTSTEIRTTSGFSAILPSTCEPQLGQKPRDTAWPALLVEV